ncbi:DNA-(apurinic or apyrimidinic site) lyase [Balamuthia mandrillaris]
MKAGSCGLLRSTTNRTATTGAWRVASSSSRRSAVVASSVFASSSSSSSLATPRLFSTLQTTTTPRSVAATGCSNVRTPSPSFVAQRTLSSRLSLGSVVGLQVKRTGLLHGIFFTYDSGVMYRRQYSTDGFFSSEADGSKYLKVVSWNVNGLNAVAKKGALLDYVLAEQPDILCLQETKLSLNKLDQFKGKVFQLVSPTTPPEKKGKGSKKKATNEQPAERKPDNDELQMFPFEYYNCSQKRQGYSGTAIYSKLEPLAVSYGIGKAEHDREGRNITLEFPDFFLVNTYVPNAGEAAGLALAVETERLMSMAGVSNDAKWFFRKRVSVTASAQKKKAASTGDEEEAEKEASITKTTSETLRKELTKEEEDGEETEEDINYGPVEPGRPKRLAYRQVWNKDMHAYLQQLQQTKPVLWVGDLNVAHTELDIHDPTGNHDNAGFTPEERHDFGALLANGNFVDTFRHFHPEQPNHFTFWSYRFHARSRNRGWRLDYCLASKGLMPRVHGAFIREAVLGSDHCPVGVLLRRSS